MIVEKNSRKNFLLAGLLFCLFILFTVLVVRFDVHPIGPERSAVGFASINQFVFRLSGVNMLWYSITDWLGIAAILCASGFAVLGLCQLIKRRSLRKVDRGIMVLGAFYILVAGCYLFFEQVIINYRPMLMDGVLEASYPSSHTLIVVCIAVTSAMQFRSLFPSKKNLCRCMDAAAFLLSALTVIGRLLSGVHWFTDIVGGLILSAALIALYRAVTKHIE